MKNIHKQVDELERIPVKRTKGYFELNTLNEPVWIPDPLNGEAYMYQPTQSNLVNGYVSGCDPADHDYTDAGSSNLSFYIMKKQVGLTPPEIVFSYTCRPKKTDEFYEQAAFALMYYNDTKCLIENNRYGMIKYFEYQGWMRLLRLEPIQKNLTKKRQIPKVGIRKTTASTIEMERCINNYTTDYCDRIPELELLEELKDYGTRNVDRAIAFGWTVVALDDEYKEAETQDKVKPIMPNFGIKRHNGKIVRYNSV